MAHIPICPICRGTPFAAKDAPVFRCPENNSHYILQFAAPNIKSFESFQGEAGTIGIWHSTDSCTIYNKKDQHIFINRSLSNDLILSLINDQRELDKLILNLKKELNLTTEIVPAEINIIIKNLTICPNCKGNINYNVSNNIHSFVCHIKDHIDENNIVSSCFELKISNNWKHLSFDKLNWLDDALKLENDSFETDNLFVNQIYNLCLQSSGIYLAELLKHKMKTYATFH